MRMKAYSNAICPSKRISLEATLWKVLLFSVRKTFWVEAGNRAKNIRLVALLKKFAVSSVNFKLVRLFSFFFR